MKSFRRLLASILMIALVSNSAFASTFIVTSDLDSSDASPGNGFCDIGGTICTLRAAIEEANALAGADTINFTTGNRSLTPGSTMTISSQVTIDGTTAGAGNKVALDGNDGTFAALTLDGNSDGTIVKALYIYDYGTAMGNSGIGIDIQSGANNIDIGSATVGEGNVIGLQTDGTTTDGNNKGIRSAGTNIRIRENIISANTMAGIEFITGAQDSIVTRNCIGGNVDCNADRGNTFSGISVIGSGTLDGGDGGTEGLDIGDTSSTGNTIIGNDMYGVSIGDNDVTAGGRSGTVRFQGNNVGMNSSGTAIGNTMHGFFVDNDSDDLTIYVGDDDDATNIGSELNLFGSNGGDCINILEGSSVVIAGNTIGLNASDVARGCTGSGIEIGDNDDYPTTVRIGSDNDSSDSATQNNNEVNTIASNSDGGIKILNAQTVTIAGNSIGVGSSGTSNRGNTGFAIKVSAPFLSTLNIGYGGSATNSSGYNFIGYTTNSSTTGTVSIETTANAAAVEIKGTFVGRANDFASAIGNAPLAGINLSAAANYILGADNDGTNETTEFNVIAGNAGDGIRIADGALTAILSGNRIGVVSSSFFSDWITASANGTAGTVGSMNGVKVNSNTLTSLTLGTTRNIIGANPEHGLLVSNMAIGGTLNSQAVYFGVGNDGTTDLGNGGDGIHIEAAAAANGVTFNVGSTTASMGNVISGNTGDGVEFAGTNTSTLNVLQNTIGLNAAGTAALLNGGSGVKLANSFSTANVGDGTSSGRNIISGNSAYGVNATSGNVSIKGNYIGTNAAGTSSIVNTLGSVVATSTNGSISGLAIGSGTGQNTIDNTTLSGVTLSGVDTTNIMDGENTWMDSIGPFALTGASYYWWYKSATEYGPKQCYDGYDNDSDTRTDYPNDLGCDGRQDDAEAGESTASNSGGAVVYIAPAATCC